jgi:hypothetical protein
LKVLLLFLFGKFSHFFLPKKYDFDTFKKFM